jgi:hypothetical protein
VNIIQTSEEIIMITRDQIARILFFVTAVMVVCFSGCSHMEIISMDPPSPAVLESGQRLYVKFKYDSGGAKSIRTWVRSDGKSGCKSHPCRAITDMKGVYEGWFFFEDNAAEVKEIRLLMSENNGKPGYIFENSVPVDYTWKAPKSTGPRGYAVPGTSVRILSTDPALPAVFKPGEEFKVKFQYDAGDAKSITIHSWPNKKGKCFPSGYKRNFNNSKNSIGEYEYSMVYDEPKSMKYMRLRLTNNETGRILIEYVFPLDASWEG